MHFEFSTAAQIIFGTGKVRKIGTYASILGQQAMVVTGRNPALANIIHEQLDKQGVEPISFSVKGEPTTDMALAGVQKACQAACDWIISIGGGSVIDTLLTNEGKLLEYLEAIGEGKPLEKMSATCVVVLTTVGNGG
jgi:alcohol dehydrogenase class IV